MRTNPFILLATLTAFAIGCGKDYKPEANPKGGGEHTPIDIDLPRPSPKPSSGGSSRPGGSGSLQGEWRLTRFDLIANETENAILSRKIMEEAPTVSISGTRMTFNDPKGKADSVPFQLKGGRDIDLNDFPMFGPGTTIQGIYEVTGDTLKLALQTMPGGPRPTEFRASNVSLKEMEKKGDRPHVIVMHLRRIGGMATSGPSTAIREDDESVTVPDPVPPRPKPPIKPKGFEAPKAPAPAVPPGGKDFAPPPSMK